MATAKKTATTRKSKAVVQDVEQEVKEIEADVVQEVDVLEGKTVQELRYLHDDAIIAESEAKRLVTILRQRAANEAVTIETKTEEDIIAAKKAWGDSVSWLRKIEKALENEFKDISGVHKY